MKTKYRIAEIFVEMEAKHAPLIPRSEKYRYDGPVIPECDLSLSDKAWVAYREHYPEASDALIEYMITGSHFYRTLISHSGFLLHSSAVELDGKAYLFSAPSGTGKSTHTSLWQKEFPDAKMINDDKPAIRILNNGIYVYGTPWSGKTDQNRNCKVPLQGIAFLSRGTENKIEPMAPAKALENLLSQTVRPGDRSSASALLDLLGEIIKRVPIYSLTCNMEPEAAHVSFDEMKKGVVK